jgi:ribosomal biogenesis protein LAS1
MNTAFRFWDSDLQKITVNKPAFLAALLSEFESALSRDSSIDPDTDSSKKAVFLWMDHLLTSKTWSPQRSAVNMKDMFEKLMESCLLTPSLWTHHLCKLLLDIGDAGFHRDWINQYQASVGDDFDDTEMQDAVGSIKSPQDQSMELPQKCGWQPYDGVWTPRPIGQL